MSDNTGQAKGFEPASFGPINLSMAISPSTKVLLEFENGVVETLELQQEHRIINNIHFCTGLKVEGDKNAGDFHFKYSCDIWPNLEIYDGSEKSVGNFLRTMPSDLQRIIEAQAIKIGHGCQEPGKHGPYKSVVEYNNKRYNLDTYIETTHIDVDVL